MKDKPKKARSHDEDNDLVAFFDYLKLLRMDIYNHAIHIPNGGKRNQLEAVRLKRQGVKAGFPDIAIFAPKRYEKIEEDENGEKIVRQYIYAGLFIELKRKARKGKNKGVLSKKQIEWLNRLAAAGYHTAVAYGWEEAIEIVKEYCQIQSK